MEMRPFSTVRRPIPLLASYLTTQMAIEIAAGFLVKKDVLLNPFMANANVFFSGKLCVVPYRASLTLLGEEKLSDYRSLPVTKQVELHLQLELRPYILSLVSCDKMSLSLNFADCLFL
jgi:hypothetical protein